MCILRKLNSGVGIMVLTGLSMSGYTDDYREEKEALAALSGLQAAPEYQDAEGFDSSENLKAIYFDALPWQGNDTKVFAWLGMPENAKGKVPGVVLVHGGGGTAFKEWVQRWNDQGFAAISIGVEGQTDIKPSKEEKAQGGHWASHQWPGPRRSGIYGDSQKSFKDQWMYHAVADTILANSLLRSLPAVDEEKVGLMGISWGGVITSTTMGLDNRFAFAIPTYGCGHLFDAENQYGRSLGANDLYKQVLDPIQNLSKAKMPSLWFSWPQDSHFPMDCFAASYGEVSGAAMVALVPKMGHGHGPPWRRPESYAFAQSVVSEGEAWAQEVRSGTVDGEYTVFFKSARTFDKAVLVSTVDQGITGAREWVESSAELSQELGLWVAKASLPEGTTGWFMNLHSEDLIVSSAYQEQEALAGQTTAPAAQMDEQKSAKSTHLEKLFRMMDDNYNDGVTLEEFTGFWYKRFKSRDADGDGILAGAELGQSGWLVGDANEDRRLTADEDLALRQQHFHSLDKDSDGTITFPEMVK